MVGESGELGIRTPGPVTVNSFQDCRNRPLCQLSGCKIIVLRSIYQKKNEFDAKKIQVYGLKSSVHGHFRR
jgi:hypothetical protein